MNVPSSVAKALTLSGGKTPSGLPMYKFAWSEQETYLLSNGHSYEQFRICAEPCWLLMKWEGAEFWGSEAEWERINREPSGLMTAGPYPSQGRYRMVRKLLKTVQIDDVLTLVRIEPSLAFVEKVFPYLRDFLELTDSEKAAVLATREKDEKKRLARSFSESRKLYKGAGTAKQIKDKTEAIERWLKNPANIAAALALKGAH